MLSDLSYLSYPLPPDIQRLFEAGDFERMARVIEMRLSDPRVPETLRERLRVQLVIANQLPGAYPHARRTACAIAGSGARFYRGRTGSSARRRHA